MKVVVIGLGSMGKRRIRLVQKYDADIEIIGVDSLVERRKDSEELYSIKTYCDLADTLNNEDIDCAFVCTSPISHSSIIHKCLCNNWHVFTELNLIPDGYDENIFAAKEKKLVLFLSSTFLYREEICYIANELKNVSCVINYVYHIGQYLPDWHPWEDYSNYFVSDKRTNGCREIMALELPWITSLFDSVKNISVVGKKISNLNIDYPDSYMIILEHKNGNNGVLVIDVVSRKAVRNFELYGENIYISWDGSPTGLYKYDFVNKVNMNIKLYSKIDKQENYAPFVIENAYMNEIIAFFDKIQDPKNEIIYDFEKDKKILELIDRIEKL